MEGSCCGDAVRVVVEEAADLKARPTSFTDSSSAQSIVGGESGSWRTRHLRKRANALRQRVSSGDWVIRHMPGSLMPADAGTKVMAADRFHFLREQVGMSKLPEDLEKKEDGTSRSKKGIVTTALKALVLAVQVAQTRGEETLKASSWSTVRFKCTESDQRME